MAHLNMHHRVEESWRRNTAAVAERIDGLVRVTGARVLVVAGRRRGRGPRWRRRGPAPPVRRRLGRDEPEREGVEALRQGSAEGPLRA